MNAIYHKKIILFIDRDGEPSGYMYYDVIVLIEVDGRRWTMDSSWKLDTLRRDIS